MRLFSNLNRFCLALGRLESLIIKEFCNTIYIDEKHGKNYSVEGASPAFAKVVKRLPIHHAIKFILPQV
ncbi:MAG: hypothetical protein RIR12_1745 [Bacteroidota bacterium]|jgi:hypothetical protein